MAMIDDPEWLLSHIRHSFITSDDTGMCEMVIQDNDLLTLEEHRKQLQNQAKKEAKYSNNDSSKPTISHTYSRNRQNSRPNTAEELSMVPRAPSPDILSGWDFGVRRRSNTAQKLERIRKERQSRVKVKTVHWKQMPERYVNDHLDKMFEKKNLSIRRDINCSDSDSDASNETNHMKQKLTNLADMQLSHKDETDGPVRNNVVAKIEGFNINNSQDEQLHKSCAKSKTKTLISSLSKQLAHTVQLAQNPFKDFAKFDGRGHEGTAVTQQINMFVYAYGEPPPVYSMSVVILVAGAKVQDLIGLTCWRYITEESGPELKRTDVQGYSLYICEDDGEVDYGLPQMDSHEPVSKFSFRTLALVEKHQIYDGGEGDGHFKESLFVKVTDYTGFALIRVDNLSVTMGEILKKAILKRKRTKYLGSYRLEYQDKPGVVLDEDQTLESTGVMEFCMVREHSARSFHNFPLDERANASEKPNESKPHTTPAKTVQFRGL